MTYKDLDPRKKAYIFELDNVLYPEKDYLLQVYYLFANFIEYTETVPSAAELTAFMKKVYDHHGAAKMFDKVKEAFNLDENYRENFERLHRKAKLPLKLLLYQSMLTLLQEIVVDRKKIFLITNGSPEQQLNKIKQVEWHGLEEYLVVYFAEEFAPKPDTAVLDHLLSEHQLVRRDLLIIGNSSADLEFAESSGVDHIYFEG